MVSFQRVSVFLLLGLASLALVSCGRPQGVQTSGTIISDYATNFSGFPTGNDTANVPSGTDDAALFGDMASDGTGNFVAFADFDGDDFDLLRDGLEGMSLNQQNSFQNSLSRSVNACDFLKPFSASDETNCKNGSSSGCSKHLLGFGRKLFQKMLRQLSERALGTSAQLGGMLKSEAQMCASIDANDHSRMKAAIEQKKANCMRGDIRSCLGLLLLLIKSFLGAILTALFSAL